MRNRSRGSNCPASGLLFPPVALAQQEAEEQPVRIRAFGGFLGSFEGYIEFPAGPWDTGHRGNRALASGGLIGAAQWLTANPEPGALTLITGNNFSDPSGLGTFHVTVSALADASLLEKTGRLERKHATKQPHLFVQETEGHQADMRVRIGKRLDHAVVSAIFGQVAVAETLATVTAR